MLTQVNLMPMINVIDPVSKAVIITMTISIQDDGIEIARSTNAMTFQANQIDEAKTFIGLEAINEITYLTAIWS